ncbi:MAG TPA: cytochrome b/b6 domain-containing protein [Caulobacteraceae bacterium]|nr:cytochrome b/b6 domain-containing protein [Caulobacteraceae bacterium]
MLRLPQQVPLEGVAAISTTAQPAKTRVAIWDWPTRLVHWLIMGLVAFCWWSAETDQLALHETAGEVLVGLVVFRLIWGVVGSSTARFSDFLRGPRAVIAYVGELGRGKTGRAMIGHNPLGGWSVAAMLGLLALDLGLGLFAVDVDGDQPGPFANLISFDDGRTIAHVHHWVFNALLALIALHLVAIAFYALVRRDNLVGPMLTGAKAAHPDAEPMTRAPLWRLAVAAAIAALAAVLIARGGRL